MLFKSGLIQIIFSGIVKDINEGILFEKHSRIF